MVVRRRREPVRWRIGRSRVRSGREDYRRERQKPSEDGKLLAGIGLQIFQGLLRFEDAAGETLGTGWLARMLLAGNLQDRKGKEYFWQNGTSDLQQLLRRSWGSHPRLASGVFDARASAA